MAHYLHLIESTVLFGGSTVTDLDLGNSGGSSKYGLQDYDRGEPQYKKIYADNPLVDGKRLVNIRLDWTTDVIVLDISASSIDDLLLQVNNLTIFFLKAMNAQVARNAGSQNTNYYWLSERPKNTSTKTYKREVMEGVVKLPKDFYGPLMLASAAEGIRLTLSMGVYVSASTIVVFGPTVVNNADTDYVDIAASGAGSISGDQPQPLLLAVKGGTTLTNRLMAAVRYRGTPSNFKQIYWGKDATFYNNVASFTGNYTVTNKVLTSNVATLTIGTHKHQIGDSITVTGVDATFNGTWTVTAIAGTTVSYADVHANVGSTASGGTVTGEIDGNNTGNGARLTPNATVTNKVLTSNVATLTIGAHSWKVGDTIVVTGVDATFNGTWVLTAVAGTTVSYADVHADVGTVASGGNVAIPTTEIKLARWTNTTNTSDQFVQAQAFARVRSSIASRWSLRGQVGLTDGTVDVFPAGSTGYFTTDVNAVGTDSGNAWSWVPLGEVNINAPQTVYGIVYQLWGTCSDASSSPLLDIDAGIWLFPVGEGPDSTGFCMCTYDVASGAASVDTVNISALPGDPPAYAANATPTVTFQDTPESGNPFYGIPQQAGRLYAVLLDANSLTNLKHDYTLALTETLTQELRNTQIIGA